MPAGIPSRTHFTDANMPGPLAFRAASVRRGHVPERAGALGPPNSCTATRRDRMRTGSPARPSFQRLTEALEIGAVHPITQRGVGEGWVQARPHSKHRGGGLLCFTVAFHQPITLVMF